MFVSVSKNKEPKCIFVQIEQTKGSPFHFQKSVDQKYLWRSRNYQEPSKSIIRFLTIVIWNLEKGKRQKLKNNIFGGPLIVNQTFPQAEYVIGESDFAHNMQFHWTKCLIFVH